MGEIQPKKSEGRGLTKDQLGSAGVVLWELITRKEPYKGMAPLQVIAAVVFQGQRLPQPTGCDPRPGRPAPRL